MNATTEQAARLNDLAEAVRLGDRGLVEHWLDAGRIASEFVTYCVRDLGHSREACVKVMAGKLAECGRDIDPNRLMRTYHAVRLLSGETEYRHVPYSTLEQYQLLVDRQHGEEWTVIPHVEPRARELFRRACQPTPKVMIRADVTRAVYELVAESRAKIAVELSAVAAKPGTPVAAERAAAERAKESAASAAARAQRAKAAAERPLAQGRTSTTERAASPAGPPPDAPTMALELLAGGDAPDDAVLALMQAVARSPEFGKRLRLAIADALKRYDAALPSRRPVASRSGDTAA